MDTTALDRQFGDFLLLVTVALRSGYSLRQTFETAATYAPEPTVSMLRQWLSELGEGRSYDEAFHRTQETWPSPHLARFVEIMQRHQQVGGNLAMMVEAVADQVRAEVETDRAFHPHIRETCRQLGASVPDDVRGD